MIRMIALVGGWIAVAALVMGLGAGLGHRWGWWSFGTGFAVLKWAAYAALAALLISLVAAVLTRPGTGRPGFLWALFGAIVAIAVLSVPALWLSRARELPRIHDISTDTAEPPRFQAILPLRAGAPNSAEYGGMGIALQQQAAYPDIRTLLLDRPPAQVFDQALAVAEALGWEIVAQARGAGGDGRIEATDTTFWFGFKDDIVIRIRAMDGGSRVDLRSVSRVGLSDVGTNARRIRDFGRRLQAAGPG